MSRYKSGEFFYGYDNPLQEYFLQKSSFENDDMDIVELVGCMSNKIGNAANMLAAIQEYNVQIPEEHRTKIMLDLPF